MIAFITQQETVLSAMLSLIGLSSNYSWNLYDKRSKAAKLEKKSPLYKAILK